VALSLRDNESGPFARHRVEIWPDLPSSPCATARFDDLQRYMRGYSAKLGSEARFGVIKK
jgi:hypothetical protein